MVDNSTRNGIGIWDTPEFCMDFTVDRILSRVFFVIISFITLGYVGIELRDLFIQ
jgi:hypothetical protein